MVPPGKVQIPGFENNDGYFQVVSKTAKGLGLEAAPHHRLALIISNSLVKDKQLPSGKALDTRKLHE